jgi:hypothetical protein
MTELKYGDRVRYGLSIGTVINLERKYGIDGVKVMEQGSAYARWVPLTNVTPVTSTDHLTN